MKQRTLGIADVPNLYAWQRLPERVEKIPRKMSQPPVITVVMPVYNTERYLALAIRSILDQTFGDFEFLIYDDESTDRSRDIVKEFAATDSRIRLIESPHVGYVALLKRGVEEARASLIARMDSDDISQPTRFEKQLAHLRANPRCLAVGGGALIIDPDGLPIMPLADVQTAHAEIESNLLHRKGIPMLHPSVTMRRDAVLSVGNYRLDRHPSEDMDLFLRLAEVGELANLPDTLIHYRRHPNSVCGKHGDKQIMVMNEIVAEAHARRGLVAPASLTQVVASEPPSLAQLHKMWAWKALKSGYVQTARRHALKLLRLRPLSPVSWRLVYCAMRGH